ncbi:MAG TPA: helix-turn-helix domain-containing protein [Nitrobacter sp.]|nr:helix-turn-helix domain-containing protein [Nitrobacter sp.]
MSHLLPSSALRIFRFDDIDDFRQAVEKVQIKFTPLARRISSTQAILSLPGCNINVVSSFPRILDGQLVPGCTAIGFAMDDRLPLVMNGRKVEVTFLAIGHGGGGYTALEKDALQFASLMFMPEVRDRGWPDPGRDFAIFAMEVAAQQRLRALLLDVLEFASASPDDLNLPGVADGIRESLLTAIDQAFASLARPRPDMSLHTARSLEIVRKIEDLVAANLRSPVYSGELAREVGVSVRTLHNAVREHRGTSLHRYLRLKRLWLVRQRLREGDISVKACALAHGFWHLGEFSRSYREQFGEPPSVTLARAR